MNILILAAGFGTRLWPLTEDLPKSLLKINNKPLIEQIINQIFSLNPEKIYILSNNKFYINFLEWLNEFKKTNQIAEKIHLLNNGTNKEIDKKGAISDLKFALKMLNGSDLLLIAGDNLFDFNLQELIDLSNDKNSSSVALKLIEDIEIIKRCSCVLIDENKHIDFFEEKPNNPRSNILATACYFLKKQDIEKIKQHTFENTDNIGNIVDFLVKDSEIYGKIYNGFWLDIGSIKELELAKNHFQAE